MAIEAKAGQTLRVEIKSFVNRASARKTLERLFMQDRAVAGPIEDRSQNFIPLPKRRGGCIWTKRPNKVHPPLNKGDAATIPASPQAVRDLNSVETFVSVTVQ